MGRLVWLLLMLLAFVIFERTSDPLPGIILAGAGMGREDLAVAAWLVRVDRHRPRGRACAWFHVSLGLLRVGAAAFAVTWIFVFAAAGLRGMGFGLPGRAIRLHLTAIALTSLSGLLLAVPAAAVATGLALAGGVRAWVGRDLVSAYRSGRWPPVPVPVPGTGRGLSNAAAGVVLLVRLSMLSVVPSLLLGLGVALALRAGGPAGALILAAGGFLSVASLLVLFAAGEAVAQRVVAADPWECWSEGPAAPGAVG